MIGRAQACDPFWLDYTRLLEAAGSTLFPYTTLFRSPELQGSPCRELCHCRSAPCTVTKLRSEEHTSELQSQFHLVCRLLLEKKKFDEILEMLGTDRAEAGLLIHEGQLTYAHSGFTNI